MLTPETTNPDLRCLASGRDFHGHLTLENLDAVADRLRALIGNGQKYTWVACNEGLSEYRPEVRTSQVATKVLVYRGEVDGVAYGAISVNDTYGAWGIFTEAADQPVARRREVGRETVYLNITHDKIHMDHRAPAGYRLYWVVAVERPE